MLRVVGNRVRRLLATQPVDVGRIARGDCEPVLVGLGVDLLALVEVALDAGAEDVAAEIGRQLHVEVDIFAIFAHALRIGHFHGLGSIALGVVGAVGCPGDSGQGHLLGDLPEEWACRVRVRRVDRCRTLSGNGAQSCRQEGNADHDGGSCGELE